MPGVPWCDLVGVVSPEAGKALDHFHEQIGKPLDPLGAPVQRGRDVVIDMARGSLMTSVGMLAVSLPIPLTRLLNYLVRVNI